MPGNWREVVRLAFEGPRFRDHRLHVGALGELNQFQTMVTETAKALWRESNPQRERLPRGFEQQTLLWLRRIESGSAVLPLELAIGDSSQPALLAPEVESAVSLIHESLLAADAEQVLPQSVSKDLVREYQRFGECLADDECIRVTLPGEKGKAARVTVRSRSWLAAFVERSYEAPLDVTGEVLEADVRQRRFQVWLDRETCVTVSFAPGQERLVVDALRDHETVHVRIVGRGEHSAEGKPTRVTQVDELWLQPVGEVPFDPSARPIEEVLAELAAEVPQEEWDSLPRDLTDNLDHYVYGTPKR
ncbi:MAG: hypothetical protein ACE5O2_00125 [Armatimonadota bacterium]